MVLKTLKMMLVAMLLDTWTIASSCSEPQPIYLQVVHVYTFVLVIVIAYLLKTLKLSHRILLVCPSHVLVQIAVVVVVVAVVVAVAAAVVAVAAAAVVAVVVVVAVGQSVLNPKH